MDEFDPGAAVWAKRTILRDHVRRIRAMRDAVGEAGDFALSQWAQLIASTMHYEPDLVLELGRGGGNSTCSFLEAKRLLGASFPVISLCLSSQWREQTIPR